jgi:hypothetical protein
LLLAGLELVVWYTWAARRVPRHCHYWVRQEAKYS